LSQLDRSETLFPDNPPNDCRYDPMPVRAATKADRSVSFQEQVQSLKHLCHFHARRSLDALCPARQYGPLLNLKFN